MQPETFDSAVDDALQSYRKCVDDNPTSSWFCPFENLKGGKEADVRLGIGIYVAALVVWRSIWGAEPLLVLRTEDLECSAHGVMETVFTHIGVRPSWTGQPAWKKSRVNERELDRMFAPSHESVAKLKAFYRPFNRQLAVLMDDSKFLWEDSPCNKTKTHR